MSESLLVRGGKSLSGAITNGPPGTVDVVGTINGESATGDGRILTGDSGAATIAGLSLPINCPLGAAS